MPSNKPLRVVVFGDFAVPCGGTHVANLVEIDKVTVRKIKIDKNFIKVCYELGDKL